MQFDLVVSHGVIVDLVDIAGRNNVLKDKDSCPRPTRQDIIAAPPVQPIATRIAKNALLEGVFGQVDRGAAWADHRHSLSGQTACGSLHTSIRFQHPEQQRDGIGLVIIRRAEATPTRRRDHRLFRRIALASGVALDSANRHALEV